MSVHLSVSLWHAVYTQTSSPGESTDVGGDDASMPKKKTKLRVAQIIGSWYSQVFETMLNIMQVSVAMLTLLHIYC